MEKETQLIKEFWTRDKDTVDKENLDLSLQELQADAESVIVAKRKAVFAARKDLDNARKNALNNPNFNAISSAMTILDASEFEFDNSVEHYVTIFGENPKIAEYKNKA